MLERFDVRESHTRLKPWKEHNSVYIHTGELPPKLILELIDHSYDMVVKGLPKKVREQYFG